MDGWMDGWMGDRQDAAQFGTCLSPHGGGFIFIFSKYKKDCYDYLTVCPSHFTPHLSSCE